MGSGAAVAGVGAVPPAVHGAPGGGGMREGALFPVWSTAAVPTRMRPTPYEAPGAAADPAPKHAVDQGSASWWR